MLAAASFALSAGPALAGKGAATGPGTLEICVASDNGTAGTTFAFTVTSVSTGAGQAVSVLGGTCSSSLQLDGGKYLLQEDLSSGLWGVSGVTTQPAANLLSEKDSIGQAKVNVPSAADTAVTFTDQPAQATLQVCKWSRTPALQGSQFSFTIGQSTVTAVAGSSASSAGCSGGIPFQPGSKVLVAEALPAGEKVADVRVGGNATLTGWKSPQAKVTIGIGVNTITFEDEPLAPPQTGFIEICKDAGDQFISGTYSFTLTDRMGATYPASVVVGQCSGPIQVPAGNVTIAEAAVPNVTLTNVWSSPANALGLTNLANGTATVVVPVSADSTGEVQVHFTNSSVMGSLQVCSLLPASSAMLAGTTFTFDIQSAAGSSTATVVATASGSGRNCSSPTLLPAGSTVTASEEGMQWVSADGGSPGAGDTQTITIQKGFNYITFTNQAIGQAEICKNMQSGDEAFNGTVFGFTVSGMTGTTQVAAGQCSLPLVVPAGTLTISETAIPTGFGFVSSTAIGPLGDNRATSGSAANGGNPITVTVPWFASSDSVNFGETKVTVVNRAYSAQLKICTVIDPGSTASLGGTTFTYSIAVNSTFVQNFTSQTPYPSCSGLMLNVWIVDPTTGKAASIKVKETSYTPSSMTVDNTASSPPVSTGAAYIQFPPGVGVDTVTFTNK